MKATKWPFRIDHITNDGEHYKSIAYKGTAFEQLSKLVGVGIISNEYLQGIQTRICANLQNPTTVIEFSPDEEPVRTDSSVLFFAMHPPCRIFRRYSYHKCCIRCDNKQAMLFCGLDKSNLIEGIEKGISENNDIRDYISNEELEFGLIEDRQRPFLEYDCPLLGYRELLFPLFFEGKVLGTFFVGQLCLEKKLDLITKRHAKLFQKHPEYFSEFIKANPSCSVGKIQKDISEAHRKWIEDLSHVLDEKKYSEFIKRCCIELDGFEKTLVQEIELQRERYVRRRVDKRIRHFRDNLPRKEAKSDEKWLLLWKNVERRQRELISDFAIRYYVVFGSKTLATEKRTLLEVVTQSGNLPENLARKIETGELKFNLDKVPKGIHSKWVTSAQDPRIFNAFEGWKKYNQELNLVRFFPVPFFSQAALVVLVGYHDWNPLSSIENEPKSPLSGALPSFYTVVLSAMSSVLAATAQEKMEASLRIFGHETGQLTAGLDWLRTIYLSESEHIENLTTDKRDDLCRDIEGYLRQLLLLAKQARMLIAIGQVNKTFFLAYKELLFKWKDTYRLEAERKKLQFDIYYPEPSDPLRPKIFGDQMLLEQLVYNLVNNAVKYCYRGTKIRLDCRKVNELPASPHVLTVTNYGIRMEGGEEAYGLYWQGSNVSGTGGLGIGLFVAKQIANAHRGAIDYKCEKVSEYNVPLIEAYLHGKIPWKDEMLEQKLITESKRLKEIGLLDELIAMDEYGWPRYRKPTVMEIVNSLRKKTWKVTFVVSIPAKGK